MSGGTLSSFLPGLLLVSFQSSLQDWFDQAALPGAERRTIFCRPFGADSSQPSRCCWGHRTRASAPTRPVRGLRARDAGRGFSTGGADSSVRPTRGEKCYRHGSARCIAILYLLHFATGCAVAPHCAISPTGFSSWLFSPSFRPAAKLAADRHSGRLVIRISDLRWYSQDGLLRAASCTSGCEGRLRRVPRYEARPRA